MIPSSTRVGGGGGGGKGQLQNMLLVFAPLHSSLFHECHGGGLYHFVIFIIIILLKQEEKSDI